MSPSKNKPLVWAEVDLNKLRKNFRFIRSLLAHPQKVETLAVVKADAYGHGMKAVAQALKKEGVRFFGVANVDEGTELRRAIGRGPRILLLGSFREEDLPRLLRHRLIPTLSSIEEARALCARLKKPFPVHVKIDTGMGRLGVWHEEAASFFYFLKANDNLLKVDGLYTHLASADSDAELTRAQLKKFNAAVRAAKQAGLAPHYFHAANSAGVARFKDAHFNLVRPGILLYGVSPVPQARWAAKLEPILELKTRIAFLKDFDKGRAASYGATWRAAKKTTVATLPVGYSHGFRRSFSNAGQVALRGRLCPVIGRVTMDHTLVDVGSVPGARRWDEVTLIGRDGKAEVTAQALADAIGTIPYEIFCSIHQRIPRLYKGIRS